MAVTSRERTRATWLTGVAGLLLLGVAIVMMAVAAPSQAQPLPQHAATRAYALSMITESWSANGPELAARSPLARPAMS
jgi:acetyl-CoA acetyltransferase